MYRDCISDDDKIKGAAMDGKINGFSDYLKEELSKYSGRMVPVKAWKIERILVKKAAISRLHPNPEDEFSFPEIGPNYKIISDYIARYNRYGTMKKPEEIVEEPLMVQKVHPDGYMLLNGHHRWAAFWSLGIMTAPVSIVNLTQETDIERMILASNHDKRATLDLDEVIFCSGDEPSEDPLRGLAGRRYREKLRLGIPALLHFLSRQGYDIWVYTAKYYSMDYIKGYFKHYSVKTDGIITGTGRKEKGNEAAKARVEKLLKEQYAETLHIDRGMVLRTFSDTKDFEEYPVSDSSSEWSQSVISVIRRLKKNEKDRT